MAALSRFPAMVANSREVAWAPPAGTGKLQTQAQLRDAALAPAVLQVLEARGCNDVAAVKRLSSATLEQMGVPPRYRDALAAALSAPAPATKWGDDDSDDTPPQQSRRRARVDDEPKPAPPPQQQWATATGGNRAQRRAAAAAAPKTKTTTTSPGFVFLCNRLSRGEVRDRKLFGLGKGQLRDM